ncbi:MAG: hypothetical protein ACT4N9_08485 [Paracoccaceae bacterium]
MRAAGTFTRALRLPAGGRADALLALLAGEGAAEGHLLPPDPTARLARITREIDETALPRALLLRTGAVEIGRIAVARRRVGAVTLPGLPDEPPTARSLAARLARIAAEPGAIALTVLRAAADPLATGTGCPVADLRAALASTASHGSLERLTARLLSRDAARLTWAGQDVAAQFSGAAEWRPALMHLSAAFRTAPWRGPGAEGMAIPLSGQQVVILARQDRQGLAAVLPLVFGLDAIGAWLRGEAS